MKLRKREIAFYSILAFAVAVTVFLLFTAKSIRKANENQITTLDEQRIYKYHYMLVQRGFEDEMSKNLYAGAKKAGEKLDILVEDARDLGDGEESVEELLKMAIAARVDGIIVEADESPEIKKLINKASEQNIPVATVGKDSSESKRKCFVGVNIKQIGEMYAGRIMKHYKGKPLNVAVLVTENQTGNDSVYRVIEQSVSRRKVNLYPIIMKNEHTFDSDEYIRSMFLNTEELPDIIVSLNEIDTVCAYKAAVDYNMVGEVQIIGFSFSQELLTAIEKGIVDSSITFNANEMGAKAVNKLFEFRDKKGPANYVTVDAQVIENGSVGQYRKEKNDGDQTK